MKTVPKYSPKFRERAVRLVFEHQGEHKTQWAAIVSILYEAERLVALRIQGHIDKQSLSAEEHKQISKEYVSLLGCIGKLHLVVDPKMMNDVNVLYEALWNIYDGFVPLAAGSEYVVTRMRTTDIDAQVNQFYQARGPVLAFMRKDLGVRDSYRLSTTTSCIAF
jgi:hypothetical protein